MSVRACWRRSLPAPSIPTVVGPAAAAADRRRRDGEHLLDPATQLTLDHVDVGAAVAPAGGTDPGRDRDRRDRVEVLGDSVGANTLEADLVPAAGDGSGWRLRSHFDGLEVNAKTVTVGPGRACRSARRGTLRSQVELRTPRGAALRWWRAVLALELTQAHAGFPAGATFLIGCR